MEPAAAEEAKIIFENYGYVDSAIGSPSNRNHVTSVKEISSQAFGEDSYLSMFRFKYEYLDYANKTGSVSGTNHPECFCDFVWFDIDRPGSEVALIDARQILANLETISPAASESALIYFSGSKGFHIGIPSQLFGLVPSVDLPAQIKRIALAIAKNVPIDRSIYEKNRLWRVPNTKHGKSGLYKTQLSYEEFATWSIEQIKEKAKTPHGEAKADLTYEVQYEPIPELVELVASLSKTEGQEGHLPPSQNGLGWIAEALANLTQGNRNATFAKIAGRLHRDGWQEQDIISLLRPHADRVGFPISELAGEVSGICSRYPSSTSFHVSNTIYTEKQETKSLPQPISLTDLMAEPNCEIDWLVEALFPSEAVAIIGGPAGAGKTWMLLDLAIECARGGLWLDHFPVKNGKVLYIDEESSKQLLLTRLSKMLKAKGIAGGLDLSFLVGQGISLRKEGIDTLKQIIRPFKPDLIIMDSLIRLHGADENSATDMARVFSGVKDIVRENGCLVVIADHHRKPGLQEWSGDSSLRGSSEKVAFVDTLLSLKKGKDHIVVEHSKSRFAQPVESFDIVLEEPIEGSVCLRVLGDHETIKNAEGTAKATEFLNKALGGGLWLSRPQLLEQAQELQISDKILIRVLNEMVERGDVEREDRKLVAGRGGKTAFYRLAIHFPDFPIYIEEKSENGKSVG